MYFLDENTRNDPLISVFGLAALATFAAAVVLGVDIGRLVAAILIIPVATACALDNPRMRSIILHPLVLAILLYLIVTGSEPAAHAFSVSQYANIQHYQFTKDYFGLPWYDSWFFPALRAAMVGLFAFGCWLIRDILGAILAEARARF